MKKVIEGKRYDTEKATVIAEWKNGHYGNDFRRCKETLYVTAKGNFFLHGEGGPLSKYAEPVGNCRTSGEDISPMKMEEAFRWCQEHDCIAAIELHFSDMVEEA